MGWGGGRKGWRFGGHQAKKKRDRKREREDRFHIVRFRIHNHLIVLKETGTSDPTRTVKVPCYSLMSVTLGTTFFTECHLRDYLPGASSISVKSSPSLSRVFPARETRYRPLGSQGKVREEKARMKTVQSSQRWSRPSSSPLSAPQTGREEVCWPDTHLAVCALCLSRAVFAEISQ